MKTNVSKKDPEIIRLNALVLKLEEEKQGLKAQKDAIENYMHTLVHDFKTPLSNISSFAELLLDDEFSKEDRDGFVRIIIDTTANMFKMISSYLLLNKFENLGGQLIKKSKTVLDLVDGIKKIFGKKYSDNQLHISPKKSEDTSVDFELFKKEVELDQDLFFSALTNLINNAIEASERSTVNVNIFGEDNFFCVSVANKGEIPKEIAEKLFQKFKTSKPNGTGLGLFSARLIAHAHGGELYYESLPGGTQFTLKIPLK
ncbi:MAG: HAMP domain-containing sensor histidine kinase [Candidatus Paceibacterota bacterium]